MENIIDFPSDIRSATVERKSSRTDVAFDGLFRFYINSQGSWDVENLEFNPHYAKTFNFQGDLQEDIDHAVSEYFEDPLEFIDLLLEVDPEFSITKNAKNDELYISVIGVFLEAAEKEGDYENGYYDILILSPQLMTFEFLESRVVLDYITDKYLQSEEKYGDD